MVYLVGTPHFNILYKTPTCPELQNRIYVVVCVGQPPPIFFFQTNLLENTGKKKGKKNTISSTYPPLR
jgi:hypothetical protein